MITKKHVYGLFCNNITSNTKEVLHFYKHIMLGKCNEILPNFITIHIIRTYMFVK